MASEETFNEFELVSHRLDSKSWRSAVIYQLCNVLLLAMPRYFVELAGAVKNLDEFQERLGETTDETTDLELDEQCQKLLRDGYEHEYVIPDATERQALQVFFVEYIRHFWEILLETEDLHEYESSAPDSFFDQKQLQKIKLWIEQIHESAEDSRLESIDWATFADQDIDYWSVRKGIGRRPDLYGDRMYTGSTQKTPAYANLNRFSSSCAVITNGPYATITETELMRAFIEVFLGPGETTPLFEIMESWNTTTNFITHFHTTVKDYLKSHFERFEVLIQRWEDIPRMGQLNVDTSLIHVTMDKEVDKHVKDGTTQSIKLTGIEDGDIVPEISLIYRIIPGTEVDANAYWEVEQSFWIDCICSSDSWPRIQERAENGIETVLWLIESMHPTKSDGYSLEDKIWSKYKDPVRESWGSPEDIPPFHVGTSSQLSEEGKYLQLLLKAWWEPWSKKDSFPRRIRNAILLASEAKNQGNPAIRFAILTSALEALLGDKRPDLTQMIATRCSVLLEPEPKNRPACQKIIKRLYNTRSKILHGEEPHAEFLDTHLMRMVLSAALRAAVGFRLMTQSIGTHDKLVDIVTEIDDHASSGQPLLGTTPQLVRIAWGVAWEKQS